MRRVAGVILSLLLTNLATAQETLFAKELRLVVSQGKGSPEGRAAWDRIVAAGPKMVLP